MNRHDGQGTASISAEFLNAYLEFIWPDPTVSVAQGAERGGIFKTSEGTQWAIEITFDGGRKAQTKDLRPDLPLIIHY